MLYEIAHIIKDKFGFLWDAIEWGNATLFSFIYRKRLKEIPAILKNSGDETFLVRETNLEDASRLAAFFKEQPEEAFNYFKPHGFDEQSLNKVLRNKAFLTYVVEEGNKIVGYFFIRSFINGKGFRGKIVDYRWRNKGIAKLMGTISMDIAQKLGIRLFGTISKGNAASFKSAQAVNNIKVIKEFENGDLYIEYLSKQ